jgi:trehalose 6-phosphate synthase/phosphatase
MDIISYRGPGVAGGISSTLGRIWCKYAHANSTWWFLRQGILKSLCGETGQEKFISLLPETLVEGHYRYCNEFLWPLMHDLPEYASYSASDHEQYRTFNRMVAEQVDVESGGAQEYFIQDYQLGIAPRWLSLYGHRAAIFWHIPWPRQIPSQYRAAVCELAHGLLGASLLGFHTDEYAHNFMDFVENNMPEYKVDASTMTIETCDQKAVRRRHDFVRAAHKSYVLHQQAPARTHSCGPTRLLVHPLGLDLDFWEETRKHSSLSNPNCDLLHLMSSTFVLSVDRVDYTKSVFERFLIIDKFLESHPEWAGSLSFLQLCIRSRPGLESFDDYWHKCRSLAASVNDRWAQENWQPIHWLDRSFAGEELAYFYCHAHTMLVNPVRDGLNLIAKEFVACQDNRPGMLLLSPGAGASHELGEFALPASPLDLEGTINSLVQSLAMPLAEKQMRMQKMKEILLSNPLSNWWSTFSRAIRVREPALAGQLEEPIRENLG